MKESQENGGMSILYSLIVFDLDSCMLVTYVT